MCIIRNTSETIITESGLFVQVSGKGTPLLLIHGSISDHTFFQECASYLSRAYKVITYDRRGYGKSCTVPYTDYSVSTQADDISEIISTLKLESFYIVGNSAGSLVGIEYALKYPAMVKGMILVEPSLGYEETEYQKLKEWNLELNSYVEKKQIKKALPAFSRITNAPKTANKGFSLEQLKQTYHNLSAFMLGELNDIQGYLPPVSVLQELPMPILVAVTEKGCDCIFATSSLSAASIIGWPVFHLPGYHNVAQDMPLDFAIAINGIIKSMTDQFFS